MFRDFTVGVGLALPAFAAPANPKICPRTVGGPAMQAPTSKRQGFRKNISLFCDFTVGAGLALPAFAVPADPKICPRTVGGPAMQAPTGKGQRWRGNRARSGRYKAGEGSTSQRAQEHTDNSLCLICDANLDFPSNNRYS